MLIYTSIFIASLIAALFARFCYKVITNKYRSVHTSNKRVATSNSSSRYQKESTGFKTYNGISVMSVQQAELVSSNLGNTHPAKPEGFHNQNTTLLIRDRKLLSMNGSYKVRRRAEPEPRTLEMVSKPFRRKDAPRAKDNAKAIRS